MDIFSMLQTANIVDMETDEPIGRVAGLQIANGRMVIGVVLFDDGFEEDDPDDGEEEDLPGDSEIPPFALVPDLLKDGTSG